MVLRSDRTVCSAAWAGIGSGHGSRHGGQGPLGPGQGQTAGSPLLDALHRPERARPLSTEEGIDAAIDWCKQDGRDQGLHRDLPRRLPGRARRRCEHAKQRFQAAGFEVSGCVTTTHRRQALHRLEAASPATPTSRRRRSSQEIFEYTAGLFDEIMIDDFWFTDCACPECDAARKAKTVTDRRPDVSRSPATPGKTTAAS